MKTMKLFLVIITLMISNIGISQNETKTTTEVKAQKSVPQQPQVKQGQPAPAQAPELKAGTNKNTGSENKAVQQGSINSAPNSDAKTVVGKSSAPDNKAPVQGKSTDASTKKVSVGKNNKPAGQQEIKKGGNPAPSK